MHALLCIDRPAAAKYFIRDICKGNMLPKKRRKMKSTAAYGNLTLLTLGAHSVLVNEEQKDTDE